MTTSLATPSPSRPGPATRQGTSRSSQSGREQTVSYADLMKPDEDWRNLPNAADRRKIQNRLAQRAYRRSLRERNEEIKRLKKQVEQLEENRVQRQLSAPPADEQDATINVAPPSLGGSPKTAATSDAAPSPSALIPDAEWMGEYLQAWPQTPDPEQHAFMGLPSDFSSMDGVQPQHQGATTMATYPTIQVPLSPAATSISHYSMEPTPDCDHSGIPSLFSTTFNPCGSDNGRSPNTSTSTSPYLTHPMLPKSIDLSHPPSPSCLSEPSSATSSCRCKSSHITSAPATFKIGGQSAAQVPVLHQNTLIQPLDASGGLNMQRSFIPGLAVEPCDAGDGFTIKLQNAGQNQGARLFAFVIQCEPNGMISENQCGRSSPVLVHHSC